jgi:adenylosuccinate synthase
MQMEGWSGDISKCSRFEDLPIQAQRYLKKIEEILGAPIEMISVGPERNQTIVAEREIAIRNR